MSNLIIYYMYATKMSVIHLQCFEWLIGPFTSSTALSPLVATLKAWQPIWMRTPIGCTRRHSKSFCFPIILKFPFSSLLQRILLFIQLLLAFQFANTLGLRIRQVTIAFPVLHPQIHHSSQQDVEFMQSEPSLVSRVVPLAVLLNLAGVQFLKTVVGVFQSTPELGEHDEKFP